MTEPTTTPAPGGVGGHGDNCIRIDLLPGYGPSLILDYAYGLVVLHDGSTETPFADQMPGDIVTTSSGVGIKYVIKCEFRGLGGLQTGTPGLGATLEPGPSDDPTVDSSIEMPDAGSSGGEPVVDIVADGCKAGSVATVSFDGDAQFAVLVPRSGYVRVTSEIASGPPGEVALDCAGHRLRTSVVEAYEGQGAALSTLPAGLVGAVRAGTGPSDAPVLGTIAPAAPLGRVEALGAPLRPQALELASLRTVVTATDSVESLADPVLVPGVDVRSAGVLTTIASSGPVPDGDSSLLPSLAAGLAALAAIGWRMRAER